MEFYFLRTPDNPYLSAFRRQIIRQNVKVAQISAVVVTVFCALMVLSSQFIDYTTITKRVEYSRIISLMIGSGIVYILLFAFIDRIQNKKIKVIASYFASNSYALVIINAMMWLSFVAQHSPANTMTMFLVGMFYTGILWLFNVWEVLVISFFSLLSFTIGLYYFQTDHEKLLLNYMVGGYVIMAFYMISRMLYSYHLNYFVQLKTIEAKNREINKINKMQTEMLGIVVHDLRSPINNIITLTELVRDYASTETERNEYYEMIQSACGEADHIIHDLIAVAKEQDQNVAFSETNLNVFLEILYQKWKHRINETRTIALKLPEKQVYAFIDTQKMQRVINNLISNAIKFTHDKGAIEIELKENDNRLRISIKDDGIGVPQNIQSYIFDRFSKAGRLGLKGEKSHGLGLSICRQIVEQHGGAIGLESNEGAGSIFNIDLQVSNISDIRPDNKEAMVLELAEDHIM